MDPKVGWAMAFVPTKSTDIRTVARLIPFQPIGVELLHGKGFAAGTIVND